MMNPSNSKDDHQWEGNTRVKRSGGKSSVQLGWDWESPEPKKKKEKVENNFDPKEKAPSSNDFASGHSQNTGNVLTDRPTSKVTQPPGGRSSIILG
ncbi:hypothetical protein ACHAXM_010964 [Skeletonema potamos]|jgi:hypothetical protein